MKKRVITSYSIHYTKLYEHDRNRIVWVNCRINRVDYQGKEALMVNMIDITHTREMERLLRIQDKMSSLGRVAAGIAHEIRNPLSGINIYLRNNFV